MAEKTQIGNYSVTTKDDSGIGDAVCGTHTYETTIYDTSKGEQVSSARGSSREESIGNALEKALDK